MPEVNKLAAVAQGIEHESSKLAATGSSPVGSTNRTAQQIAMELATAEDIQRFYQMANVFGLSSEDRARLHYEAEDANAKVGALRSELKAVSEAKYKP